MEDESVQLKIANRSPSVEKKVLEMKQNKREFEQENIYRTCCSGTSDKRFLKHMSQIIFGFTISAFCCVQLVRVNKCDHDIYVSILSGILGFFIPSPFNKRSDF